jgi:serine/threonine protein kinase
MELSSNHQRCGRRSGRTTLAGLLSVHPAKLDVVLPCFIKVIEAIEDTHANDRRHRSLEPQKILFNREGKALVPSYEVRGVEDTMIFGSPKYSAPDCFQEQSTTKNCAARDIYTLGFIFYEIFLGTKLFDPQFVDVDKRGPLGWLAWHSNAANRLLPVSELVPGFPQMLSGLVEGMMAKDLTNRIGDLRKIAATLANAFEVTRVYVAEGPGHSLWRQHDTADTAQAALKEKLRNCRALALDSVLDHSAKAIDGIRKAMDGLIANMQKAKPIHLVALVLLEAILLAIAVIFAAARYTVPAKSSIAAPVHKYRGRLEDKLLKSVTHFERTNNQCTS